MKRMKITGLAAVAAAVLATAMPAQNPATGVTSTGQDLTVALSGVPPVISEQMVGQPVLVDCLATLSAVTQLDINIILIFDVSGSMGQGDAPGVPDCNNDGTPNTRVDAACVGFSALNQSLGNGSNVEVGLVLFGSSGDNADMSPAAGSQLFASPPQVDANTNGVPDVEEVIQSADSNGTVSLFTPRSVGSGSTNYTAALAAMNAAFATQPAGEVNIAFFISDGLPNAGGSFAGELATAVAAGTTINTFGVSQAAATACNPGAPLDMIASQTGGSCTFVPNPANLGAVLPGATSTTPRGSTLRAPFALQRRQAGPGLPAPAPILMGSDDARWQA